MADKKYVITVGREFGSGGHNIAKLIASKLEISYYDKGLLAVAAKESGLCEEFIEKHEEVPVRSFLYSLVMGTGTYTTGNSGNYNMPLEQRVFLAQFDAIKKLAETESCVIVGRCADYALEESENVFKIFLTAPKDYRIKATSVKHNITINEATTMVNKADKSRASYYNYYTNKRWGAASSYDLCIDTTLFGEERTADIIVDIAKKRFML